MSRWIRQKIAERKTPDKKTSAPSALTAEGALVFSLLNGYLIISSFPPTWAGCRWQRYLKVLPVVA